MSGIVNRLNQAWNSAFVRAVAVLAGGNGVALAAPILAAPVLGRLYTPADYGALAQYMAPAAVLGVLACLQFQNAIITERADRSAGAVAWLGLLSALTLSGLSAIGVAVLWRALLSGLAIGPWFILLPLSVAGAGLMTLGQFFANRHRMYRWIAMVQVVQVLATVALSVTFGFLGWGANGLLAAYFLGQAVLIGCYARVLFGLRATLAWPGIPRLCVLARRHWKFPIFTLPSEFFSQINMQTPIFALTALGEISTIGAFTRARQLVTMPILLLGGAIGQVYRVEAAEQVRKVGSCQNIFLKTLFTLTVIGAPFALLVQLYATPIFELYLGPSWVQAGQIAELLVPLLFLRLLVSPLSYTLILMRRQGLDLGFNLLFVACNLILVGVFLTGSGSGSGGAYLDAYVATNIAIHLLYMSALYVVSRKRSTQ